MSEGVFADELIVEELVFHLDDGRTQSAVPNSTGTSGPIIQRGSYVIYK
jgi:hypothetical protein